MSYKRNLSTQYAHKWAFNRNPAYPDFEEMGGDCTNFVSQCLHAGNIDMSYQPDPWFCHSLGSRSPSWSSVELFHQLLIGNQSDNGPHAIEVTIDEIEQGDVVQLMSGGSLRFHHTLFVVEAPPIKTLETILIACHTYDSDYRPLATYNIRQIRYLHITN